MSNHQDLPVAEVFVTNINRLIGERRGVAAALAEFCSLDPSAVTKWRDGAAFPFPSSLDKIASFFRVRVIDLLDAPKKRAKSKRAS